MRLLMLLVTLAALACTASAGSRAAPPTPSATEPSAIQQMREHLANARDYQARGQLGHAKLEADKAIARSPSNAEAQALQQQLQATVTAQKIRADLARWELFDTWLKESYGGAGRLPAVSWYPLIRDTNIYENRAILRTYLDSGADPAALAICNATAIFVFGTCQ